MPETIAPAAAGATPDGEGVPRALGRRRGLTVLLVVLAAVGAAGVAVADVAAGHRAAGTVAPVADAASAAHVDLAAAVEASRARSEAAMRVADGGVLVGEASRSALAARAADAVAATDAASALGASAGVPVPIWPWEQIAWGSAVLGAVEDSAAVARARGRLDAADARVSDAGLAALAGASAAVSGTESANARARNAEVLGFRAAAAAVAGATAFDAKAADELEALDSAAAALRTSAAEQLAAKSDGHRAARLAIEDFARGLAGGVLVQVDFAPSVNGYGGATGMGGSTNWYASQGGYADITLSDSVAEQWPSADARALVAHEVGHAISAKCYALFDWQDRAANEQWATAWAISQGYTGPGNGSALYGRPADALVATAAACR